jgi:hypothetical protein
MTTQRIPRDRHRKALHRIDDAAVKLFARLEQVPLPHRMGYAFREHEKRLAKMLGLWAENFLDAHDLNDAYLISRPPKYDFNRESWERVCATRKRLLELAGLPPDVKGDPYPDYDRDYEYDDSGDFDDLSPEKPPVAKPVSRKSAGAKPTASNPDRLHGR